MDWNGRAAQSRVGGGDQFERERADDDVVVVSWPEDETNIAGKCDCLPACLPATPLRQ